MALRADAADRIAEDPVSNVLKWILLIVAIACFAALGWMTDLTYKTAPPIGWPQLNAVYEHGLAYARSQAFYDTTLFWQWMRMPGDIAFALGALLMAWDFVLKLRPLFPRLIPGVPVASRAIGGAE